MSAPCIWAAWVGKRRVCARVQATAKTKPCAGCIVKRH